MTTERMRLQKLLSRAGVTSRRRAEQLMRDGRVAVNGVIVVEPGISVDPATDSVTVDGQEVRLAPERWIALHKPAGYLTTRRDPQRRDTIYSLLAEELRPLTYVGRLDRDSEGLLLLTNEGDSVHRLTHPSAGVEREYRVLVRGEVGPERVARLVDGVELEDGWARALRARRVGRGPLPHATSVARGPRSLPHATFVARGPRSEGTWLDVVLAEGRKRELRRMLRALGHAVVRLVRVRYGPVKLGKLPPGAWRDLTAVELREIRRFVTAHGGVSGR